MIRTILPNVSERFQIFLVFTWIVSPLSRSENWLLSYRVFSLSLRVMSTFGSFGEGSIQESSSLMSSKNPS
jgi:hypothetical protein